MKPIVPDPLAQSFHKQAHLQAGLDPRDLPYLDVNPDRTPPTQIRQEFRGKVYYLSID